MISEIKYRGQSAVPTDYESTDGDLALSLGAINEDGGLRRIAQPQTVFYMDKGESVIYVHEGSGFKNYIIKKGYDLHFLDDIDKDVTEDNRFAEDIYVKSAISLGNVLLVLTGEGINYYLWKDNKYNFLGDHLPDVGISFGLRGSCRMQPDTNTSVGTEIRFSRSISGDLKYREWTDDEKKSVTETLMGVINKTIKKNATERGRFVFPFMVRWAFRLYDGTLTGHSAPILMSPSVNGEPFIISDIEADDTAHILILMMSSALDYAVTKGLDDLFSWSDIIKSIDIFVSEPIYGYNPDGLCTSFTELKEDKFIGALDFKKFSEVSVDEDSISLGRDGKIKINGEDMTASSPAGKDNILGQEYAEWEMTTVTGLFGFNTRLSLIQGRDRCGIALPSYTRERIKEKISNTSRFYLIKSIPIEELSTERQDIELDGTILETLVNREMMTDDFLSHDSLVADGASSHNSRINLFGVQRKLFKGFSASALFPLVTAAVYDIEKDDIFFYITSLDIGWPLPTEKLPYKIAVFFREEDGSTHRVISDEESYLRNFWSLGDEKLSWGHYVFYPNANAFKMILRCGASYKEFNLKAHDFLNGAYAVSDFNEIRRGEPLNNDDMVITPSNLIPSLNKLYTSEVNNPFLFPATGINTIGSGEIIGLSTATQALSQGQFGQFPLYAFTTEGVWALSVNETGGYSAIQPITRDVCINPKSITQLNNSVLFTTERGIMLLSGSQTQCITDILNSEEAFSINDFPTGKKLIELYNEKVDEYELTKINYMYMLPFGEFLKDCKIVYDYINQHVIVFNSSEKDGAKYGPNYAYVYSLKSRAWGMMMSNFKERVNSYPETLVMGEDYNNGQPVLFSFSAGYGGSSACLLFSRPFSLGSRDTFKTIDTIIQRGYFQNGNIHQVLYGSNDLMHWQPIWSSKDKYLRGFRGSPYKSFRLALIGRLEGNEDLSGFTIQFTERLNNKPR